MLWLLLLSGLASPSSLEPVIQAEALDLRVGRNAEDRAQLSINLAGLSGWQQDAIQRLASGQETPQTREVFVDALSRSPAVSTESLLWLLGAALPADARPLSARIDALQILDARAPPEAAGDLLLIFVRARLSDLPEDPDLFERALKAVLQIEDDDAIRFGLVEELPPDLLRRVHQRMTEQWVTPLSSGLSEDRLVPILNWPAENPAECRALEAAAERELSAAYDTHGRALIEALQTDGGSIFSAITRRMERALLGAWADSADAEVARIAREIRAEHAEPPPLAPPDMRPGEIRGMSLQSPRESVPVTPGAGGPQRSPELLLIGLLGVGLSLLIGSARPRARPLAGIALGSSILLTLEGGLQQTRMVTLAEDRPLFSFTDWQIEAFQDVTLGDASWISTPGGWIRHRQFEAERPDFRAIVLGASSVHGSNHLAEEAFPALLESGLRERFPDASLEVLNLGIGGTTSGGLLHTGTQALALGVDLVLVYYGHNEAAQFSRLSLYETVDPAQLAWRMRLSRSVLYSGLLTLLQPSQPLISVTGSIYSSAPPSRDDLEMLKALAASNYRHNLTQLVHRARQVGAEVVLMNPATNYRFAAIDPFEELDGAGLQADLEAAQAAWGRGAVNETAAKTAALVAQTEAAGSTQWLAAAELRAHVLAAQGQRIAARDSWQQAIDASARPGVITTEIRDALDDIIHEQGCAALDVDALFYAHSPDGISAPGLFWDDLHPSRRGHSIIATALLPTVIAAAERRLLSPDRSSRGSGG